MNKCKINTYNKMFTTNYLGSIFSIVINKYGLKINFLLFQILKNICEKYITKL